MVAARRCAARRSACARRVPMPQRLTKRHRQPRRRRSRRTSIASSCSPAPASDQVHLLHRRRPATRACAARSTPTSSAPRAASCDELEADGQDRQVRTRSARRAALPQPHLAPTSIIARHRSWATRRTSPKLHRRRQGPARRLPTGELDVVYLCYTHFSQHDGQEPMVAAAAAGRGPSAHGSRTAAQRRRCGLHLRARRARRSSTSCCRATSRSLIYQARCREHGVRAVGAHGDRDGQRHATTPAT